MRIHSKNTKLFINSFFLCVLVIGSIKADSLYNAHEEKGEEKISSEIDKAVERLDVNLEEDLKKSKEKHPYGPAKEFFPYGDYIEEKDETEIRTPLKFSKGDLEITFGGTAKIESFVARNIFLLNSKIPDEYEFFKQTVDLTLDVGYGKKRFGYQALQFFMDLRQKALWGSAGRFVENVAEIVRVDDSVVSKHKHLNDKPLIWLRGLWLKMSLDALFNREPNKFPMHYLKFGFFPFELGRGIALGTIYGASKDFLGIYTGYQNDVYAPGILLHGELLKDQSLSYDAYYSKLEERGDSIIATFNLDRTNQIGRALNPWRGVGKDNDLFAARIQYTPFDGEKAGTLELEAYGFYNAASDRKIEFDLDSNLKFGSIGFALEYYYKNFEAGGEIAMNLGHEIARAIDRNITRIVRDPVTGVLFEQYSHLLDSNNNRVAVTDTYKNLLRYNKLQNRITDDGLTPLLHSASNRFRKEFKVEFKGWMGVFDTSYKLKTQDLKFAAGVGFASGDKNPFRPDPTVAGEVRKYKGWVGLQEQYVGKRVISMFVLDARKLKRPMSISIDNESESGDDNSFTDLFFTGIGASWFPREHNEDKFCMTSNLLFYWKVHKAHRFDRETLTFSRTQFASKFLGTEWNMLTKYELFQYLQLFANMAVFLPGTFYRHMKGMPLRDDIFKKLDLPNDSSLNILGDNNLDPSDYRLGNNLAFMLNIGLVYRF